MHASAAGGTRKERAEGRKEAAAAHARKLRRGRGAGSRRRMEMEGRTARRVGLRRKRGGR